MSKRDTGLAIIAFTALIFIAWLFWPKPSYPSTESAEAKLDLRTLQTAIDILAGNKTFRLPDYESGTASSQRMIRELQKMGVQPTSSTAKAVLEADGRNWKYRTPRAVVGASWDSLGDDVVVVEIVNPTLATGVIGITKDGTLVSH